MSDTTHSEAVEKLGELIKDIKIAMLTTAATDGALHSRPMGTLQKPFDGTLCFFTDIESGKVYEVQADQNVNVAYTETDANTFVSVAGRAKVSRDRAKIKELWNPIMKAWFPDGEDSPNIALLEITIESAQYWDSPNNKIVNLAGFVKATLTGERFQPGENETVELDK